MSTAEMHSTENQPAPLRVLLVDDLDGMRSIVRKALTRQPLIPLEIVGEAENGHAALSATAWYRPEVVVMDVEMPCLDGVEATRQIKERFPAVRVVGWTMCDEATTEAMRGAGAAIVVRKEAGLAALVQALLQVASAMGRTQAEPGTDSA